MPGGGARVQNLGHIDGVHKSALGTALKKICHSKNYTLSCLWSKCFRMHTSIKYLIRVLSFVRDL